MCSKRVEMKHNILMIKELILPSHCCSLVFLWTLKMFGLNYIKIYSNTFNLPIWQCLRCVFFSSLASRTCQIGHARFDISNLAMSNCGVMAKHGESKMFVLNTCSIAMEITNMLLKACGNHSLVMVINLILRNADTVFILMIANCTFQVHFNTRFLYITELDNS